MKKIVTKRLVYTNAMGHVCYGGTEYDGHLSDENILGSIHEVNKTVWDNGCLWLLDHAGVPKYFITVEKFYYYQKTLFDYILDIIKRIGG